MSERRYTDRHPGVDYFQEKKDFSDFDPEIQYFVDKTGLGEEAMTELLTDPEACRVLFAVADGDEEYSQADIEQLSGVADPEEYLETMEGIGLVEVTSDGRYRTVPGAGEEEMEDMVNWIVLDGRGRDIEFNVNYDGDAGDEI